MLKNKYKPGGTETVVPGGPGGPLPAPYGRGAASRLQRLKESPLLGTFKEGKYQARTLEGMQLFRRAASAVKGAELARMVDIWSTPKPMHKGSSGAGASGEWFTVPGGPEEYTHFTRSYSCGSVSDSCVGVVPAQAYSAEDAAIDVSGWPCPSPCTHWGARYSTFREAAMAEANAVGQHVGKYSKRSITTGNLSDVWTRTSVGDPELVPGGPTLPEDILDPWFGRYPKQLEQLVKEELFRTDGPESFLKDDWDRMTMGDLEVVRGGSRYPRRGFGTTKVFRIDADGKFIGRPSRRLAYHVIGVKGRISFVPRGDGDVEIWSPRPPQRAPSVTTQDDVQHASLPKIEIVVKVPTEPAERRQPLPAPVRPPNVPPPRTVVGYVDMVPSADVKTGPLRKKTALKIYHAVTEVNDATAILADAMPDDRCRNMPGFAQAACVLNNFGSIDWRKAAPGLLYNQLEDKFVARVSGQIQKLTNRVDWHGPAGMQVTQFSRQMRSY